MHNQGQISIDKINIKDLIELYNGILTKFHMLRFKPSSLSEFLNTFFTKNVSSNVLITLIRDNQFQVERDIDTVYGLYKSLLEYLIKYATPRSRDLDSDNSAIPYSITYFLVVSNKTKHKIPPYFKLFLKDISEFFKMDGMVLGGRNNIVLESLTHKHYKENDFRFRSCEVVWSNSDKKVLENIDYYLNNMNNILTELYEDLNNRTNSENTTNIISSLSLPNLDSFKEIRYVFTPAYEFNLLLTKTSLQTILKIIILILGTCIIERIWES